MFSKSLKKQMTKWGIGTLIFYLLCFGFLKVNVFQSWTLLPFVESLIGVFMGAGAIAIITGIILLFQSSIQAEQEKKQEVFRNKILLYHNIIDKMEEITKDDKIHETEEKEIVSLLARIQLLANPITYGKFVEFFECLTKESDEGEELLADEKGHYRNVPEDYHNLFLEFISSARDDLEVQEEMTEEQQANLRKTNQQAKEATENLVTEKRQPYQKLDSLDEWIAQINDDHVLTQKQKDFVKSFHNKMKKLEIGTKHGKIEYTSRISMFAQEKSGSLFLRLYLGKKDTIQFNLLRNHEKNYYRPSVDGLNIENIRKYDPSVKSYIKPWGYPFYAFQDKTDVIDNHMNIILSLVETSFNTAKENKKLKVNDDNHHILEDIFNNTFIVE